MQVRLASYWSKVKKGPGAKAIGARSLTQAIVDRETMGPARATTLRTRGFLFFFIAKYFRFFISIKLLKNKKKQPRALLSPAPRSSSKILAPPTTGKARPSSRLVRSPSLPPSGPRSRTCAREPESPCSRPATNPIFPSWTAGRTRRGPWRSSTTSCAARSRATSSPATTTAQTRRARGRTGCGAPTGSTGPGCRARRSTRGW